ncbi:flavin-containing monooxygenase [Streptomyces antimicrobicus]|uniref:NAD(P)/FAD-dependent oxidoreductase n=1 Tax=Streptomyces antimicrobicus TaxID=2883108 RepID=A0ABS8B1S0_9ACTN|nr:NAD(P)/FAD-dependent oxidoreductase [Streptomyces antimicrobicus]MCB5178552.1 NAD(P)/FAD-dependent oxidoreductase [Streptomyces antimicrobicus]
MTSILEPATDGGARPATEPAPGGRGPTRHLRVAVIGTGFSGLGTAVRLLQSGIEDFLVFERADEVGGTWRDNSYPGCACDVMSHLYSFSFAQNPNWKSTFGKRDELYAYLRETADRFGVRPHIRFGHELLAARWDEGERHWRIETSQGEYTAQVLVTGTGYLSEPAVPDIKGITSFEGKVFHSSRWDHDHDLTGRNVAVIGTGASAIQFVPQIQPQVGRLDLYQRTPPWIGPKNDKPTTPLQAKLLRSLPGYQNFRRNFNMWGREILAFVMARPKVAGKMQKMASDHLKKSVPDEALRARLTPDYVMACKRLLFSNTWYPAIQQPNVDLVTDGIAEVRAHSIVTEDGTEREVDTIILGTGFQATDRPVARRIWGRDGIALREAWKDGNGMAAHRGTTVAGFPNLFMLLGPNTTLGHSSQVVMIEAQIQYVLDALKQMDKRGLASVEVRREAQDAWNKALDAKLDGTVWNAGNCNSWYLDASGRNPSIWPTYTWRFRRATKRFDLSEYQLASRVRTAEPAAHQ